MKRIIDRIPRPAGALPARAQTWLLVGVTAAIVIALLTFPGDSPKSPTEEPAVSASIAVGSIVGTGVVESAAQRIEAEAARVSAHRLQTDTNRPEPRPDGLPHPPTPVTADRGGYNSVGADPAHSLGPEDQIARQERLRRYESLRTPPLVQSRRSEEGLAPDPEPDSPSEDAPTSVPEGRPGMVSDTAVLRFRIRSAHRGRVRRH